MSEPFLLFYVGESRFGIAASLVSEVITKPPIVRVPGVDDFIFGVTVVRGRVIAILDAGSLFLVGARSDPKTSSRVLLLASGEVEAGLLVTRTSEFTSTSPSDLAPLPSELATLQAFGLGVIGAPDRLAGTLLLSGEAMLRQAQERACST